MESRSLEETPKSCPKTKPTSSVVIKVKTWSKDSHGLFDFQSSSTSYSTQEYTAERPVHIYKNTASMETLLSKARLRKDSKRITGPQCFVHLGELAIEKKNESLQWRLKPDLRAADNEKDHRELKVPYIVVSLSVNHQKKINQYPLGVGDIIKLGRTQYRVIQFFDGAKQYSCHETVAFKAAKVPLGTPGVPCRICLFLDSSKENPLIAPCKCKGSIEAIHVKCLWRWMNTKVRTQNSSRVAISFNFTKFCCELCLMDYPRIIETEEQLINLIDLERPNQPYLAFEGLDEADQNNQSKEERCLHFIKSNEFASVTIGRGQQADIKLDDISVSRVHAQILYHDNNFWIRDSTSKFGTLVALREPLAINKDSVVIQWGRSIYDVSTADPQPSEADTDSFERELSQ